MGKSSFYRDMWAEVNLNVIYENVTRIKSIIPKGVEIFTVVKVKVFGHGTVEGAGV
ncbi:hypothetical protein M3215_14265 [Bacillus cytotoxicus]|uniref:Uncharacterized protein n=1 Tax=Bacillus cytotoxicus TaxID=580165 RepID=A0ACC6A7U6_9BACI|nr:hypothetical protein [Bacillus cytotoxicus]